MAKIEEAKAEGPKVRPPAKGDPDVDVLYAVGMIMRHKKYNYDCVISGWDVTCTAGTVKKNVLANFFLKK